MRTNVYSQELILNGDPDAVILDIKKSNTGIEYSCVRINFHSSLRLHHPPLDDDRSGVSFWLPKSPDKRWALKQLFLKMAALVDEAPAETGLD